MTNFSDNLHQEAVLLTRSVENLFRKLMRLLIGRISLVKLQEMIRFIFVDEAEKKLKRENPRKNISLTQLAVLSGLDTRTLIKIRNSDNYGHPFHEASGFLREYTPAATILDVWSSTKPYVDEESGDPKPLQISGDKPSFESLFEESVSSRGVTHKSLLNRLVESGSVSIDEKSNEVSLAAKSYLPSKSADRLGAIEMGFSAVGNLVDTVTKNITALEEGSERIYQRGVWTYRLNQTHEPDLKAELHTLLERTEEKARTIIEQHESKKAKPNQLTAGVSFFYFEE